MHIVGCKCGCTILTVYIQYIGENVPVSNINFHVSEMNKQSTGHVLGC